MKNKNIYKIIIIGCLHIFLYIYLIPFVIMPAYGNNGLKISVIVALAISVTIIITILTDKKTGSKNNGKNRMERKVKR